MRSVEWFVVLQILYLTTVLLVARDVGKYLGSKVKSLLTKNFLLNELFVRSGLLVTCYTIFFSVIISYFILGVRNMKNLTKRILMVLYYVTMWMLVLKIFDKFEYISGHCQNKPHVSSPSKCKALSGNWISVDLSGHCFLLSMSTLVLLAELGTFLRLSSTVRSTHSISILYLDQLAKFTLFTVVSFWNIVYFITCAYFHSTGEKVAGTICGILSYYVIQKVSSANVAWLFGS